jgi:hypothetical protein
MVENARPPVFYVGACQICGHPVIPTELHPDTAGWSAVYDHCGETWTRGFDT